MSAQETTSADVKQLTKRKRETGELYTRRPEAELQIGKVLTLERAQVLELLKFSQHEGEDYLLDETIVYLLREPETDEGLRETLYSELNPRLWKLLKKFRRSFTNEGDFEDFGQKVELAILKKIFDMNSDGADYAQVNFGDFVVKAAKVERRGELVKIGREREIFYTEREADEDEYNSIENSFKSNDVLTDYRMMLKEGLDQLPPHIMTVAELLLDGWQVESKNAHELTIIKKLNVSSRTIRNWLREARHILADYKPEVRR